MRKFKVDKQKSKDFAYSTACGIGMGMTSFLFGFLTAATAHVAATDNNIKTIIGISIGIGVLSIPAFYSIFKENKIA